MKKNTMGFWAVQPETEALARARVKHVFAMLGGKWKLEILWLLNQRMHRFSELQRALPGITSHVLAAKLKELETEGMIRRTVFAVVPPRVEYVLADEAMRLVPVFDALLTWALDGVTASQPAATIEPAP